MFTNDLVSESVSGHKPYIPGQQPQLNDQTIKLNTNENPYPPSPRIANRIGKHIDKLQLYPDSSCSELRNIIAQLHNVDPDQVIIGNGSDDILNLCTRCFSDASKSIGFFEPSYSLYNVLASLQGCPVEKVSFHDNRFEIEMYFICQSKTNLFFLTSPHAPSGKIYKNSLFSSVLDNYRGVLVIDEAYADFVEESALPVFDANHPQLIRFRTFSKAYGLAGARVGYAITNASLSTAFNKVRNHFGVNRLAQVAVLAALSDTAHLEAVKAQVKHSLARIADIAAANHCKAIASRTNFIAIDCMKDGAFAKRVLAVLINKGMFARMPAVAPQNRCIRISAGTEQHLDLFEKIFPEALQLAEK